MTATTQTRTRGRDNGFSATRVKMTPAGAEKLLSGNTHNRTLYQADVDALVGAIQRGEWQFNGDPIRLAPDGTLLDGQHRLWAIFLSGVTCDVLLVRGLEKSSQETMDYGRRRNLRDVLKLRGFKDANNLAAVITYWWRYQSGLLRLPGRPTVRQAIECLAENPTLEDALSRARKMRGVFNLTIGTPTAAYYEFSSINQEQADAFFDSLQSGIDLKDGSPILALRRYLEQHRDSDVRPSPVVIHALFIKAWNAYRAGAKVSVVNWKATGMKAEGFPGAQ
jgi:hypothetical protein